jgi:hypothetical protein
MRDPRRTRPVRRASVTAAGEKIQCRQNQTSVVYFASHVPLSTVPSPRTSATGVYKGRPSIEASQMRELKSQARRPSDIAKALKIGRASVYRVLGQKADH